MNEKEIERVISFIENLRVLGSNITRFKEILAAGIVLSRNIMFNNNLNLFTFSSFQ